MQAGTVLYKGMPAGPLEVAQSRLQGKQDSQDSTLKRHASVEQI
jgi:hypothetical protein